MILEVFPQIKDVAKIKIQVSRFLISPLRLVCLSGFHVPDAQMCR